MPELKEMLPLPPDEGLPLPQWLSAKWPEIEEKIVEVAPELAQYIGQISPAFLHRALRTIKDRKVMLRIEKEELLASITRTEEWQRTHSPPVEELRKEREELRRSIEKVEEWLRIHPEAPHIEIRMKRDELAELRKAYAQKLRAEWETMAARRPAAPPLIEQIHSAIVRRYPSAIPPPVPRPLHYMVSRSLAEEKTRVEIIDKELIKLDAIEVSIMNMLIARARRLGPPTMKY